MVPSKFDDPAIAQSIHAIAANTFQNLATAAHRMAADSCHGIPIIVSILHRFGPRQPALPNFKALRLHESAGKSGCLPADQKCEKAGQFSAKLGPESGQGRIIRLWLNILNQRETFGIAIDQFL
jgi:hypothetical protein